MKQKVLHIVRHAKSSWDFDGIADIDRTLKSKGIRSAYEISRKLKLGNQLPDRIISSPANRALHTAVIFARVFEFPLKSIEISSLLYESSPEKILDYLKATPDSVGSVMMFGHNPDVSDLAAHFVRSAIGDIPTAGVVSLVFKTDSWKEINAATLEKHTENFPAKDE
jgi:phosphohistidine phosphatase